MVNLNESVARKLWNKLLGWYWKEGIQKAIVSYSGGKDSTLVLDSALEVVKDVKAVIVDAEVYPKREVREAVKRAEQLGAKWEVVRDSKLEDENFAKNGQNRCYYCKKKLLLLLENDATILEGTNASEVRGHRPGLRAVKEHAKSPLLEVGLGDKEVRGLLRWRGREVWNRPSFACLASRFPTGRRLTEGRLSRVERVEDRLFELGIKQLRVRDFGKMARIEVWPEDMSIIIENRAQVLKWLKEEGYKRILLDLEGYRTGSISEEEDELS